MSRTIQTSAKAALSNCRQVAQRQLAVEQQRRTAEDPLRKLLGVGSRDLNQDMLLRYNVNTLQVKIMELFCDRLKIFLITGDS